MRNAPSTQNLLDPTVPAGPRTSDVFKPMEPLARNSRVKPKPDAMYYLQPDGVFRPVENISMTASAPVTAEPLHGLQRRMILADDKTRAVQRLPKEMKVTRNAELATVLISLEEPGATVWTLLARHIARESAAAEIATETKRQAAIERKKKH